MNGPERARLLTPTGAIRTRFGAPPRYAEGLYDLGQGVFAWLVPNGSWGEANAGLVIGDGSSLLIDTAWDLACTSTMLDAMAPLLAEAPIATVVNTHSDGDHWWGNAAVQARRFVTTAASRDAMAHESPARLLALARLARLISALPHARLRIAGRYIADMLAPYRFEGLRPQPMHETFADATDLEVGGRALRLIEVGPAHTAGDLIVHVPDARVVFAGDVVFLGSTPVMWAGPVENCLRALETIIALEPEIVVPGHGPLTDLAGVRLVQAYWRMIAEHAERQFAAGRNPWRAALALAESTDFCRSPFAEWDAPERLLTNMHVYYRHRRGRGGRMGALETLDLLRRQAWLGTLMAEANAGART